MFPGRLSSPCSISPGCPLTDMSEGKIWNKVPTRLVGESLERPSLLLSRRTAAQESWEWGSTELPAASSSLSTQSPGPQAVLRWPWHWREPGVIPSSSHSQAQTVCLCKNTPEQASGEGEPISPPRCETFAVRKPINVSAMRRKLQLYLLEWHCLFQRHQEPNTWVFQHLLRNAFEERWLLGSRVWKQVSCLSRKERAVTSSFPQADDLSSL